MGNDGNDSNDGMKSIPIERIDDQDATNTTDIYLVAFLKYHNVPYNIGLSGNRVSFEFVNVSNLISEYYQSGVNNVNVLGYVEKLKQVKVEMYRKKSE